MTLTKKLTFFITTILATLFAFFSVATLRPTTAFAYTENSTARFDDSAILMFDGVTKKNLLVYRYDFDPNNYYVEDLHVKLKIELYEKSEVQTGWSEQEQVNYSALNSTNYKSLETHEINVYYEYSPRSTIARKNGVEHVYTYNPQTLKPLISVVTQYTPTGTNEVYYKGVSLVDWVNNNKKYYSHQDGIATEYSSTLPTPSTAFNEYFLKKTSIYFAVEAPSNYQNYVLAIATSINSYDRGTGTIFSDRDYKGTNTETGDKPFTSTSKLVSVATLVNNIVETNNYFCEFSNDYLHKTKINILYDNLIEQSLERNYTVYYLEPIADGVPFAKKVSKEITLRLEKGNETVNAVDVCAASGVEYFSIFGTTYNGIKEDGNALTINYPCDLWLASKTVDGKTVNHFLNINVSFQDYFSEYVQNGIIDQGLYEYLFANAIANVYPEVAKQGLSYGDIYGYWDYVVTPETVSLNTLLADVLGTESNYVGFTKEFHFESSISRQQYNTLLEKYNYNWLENTWNSIFTTGTEIDSYNATHYILICDPLIKDGFVDESGGDEDDKNAGGSVGDQLGDDIRDDVNGVIDWGKDFIAGIGSFLNGTGSLESYGSFILLAAAVIFVIYLLNGGAISNKGDKNNGKRKK